MQQIGSSASSATTTCIIHARTTVPPHGSRAMCSLGASQKRDQQTHSTAYLGRSNTHHARSTTPMVRTAQRTITPQQHTGPEGEHTHTHNTHRQTPNPLPGTTSAWRRAANTKPCWLRCTHLPLPPAKSVLHLYLCSQQTCVCVMQHTLESEVLQSSYSQPPCARTATDRTRHHHPQHWSLVPSGRQQVTTAQHT